MAGDEAHAQPPIVGGSGPTLDLQGRSERHLAEDSLLAWGPAGLVLAEPADLDGAVHLDDIDGVRQAAAGPTHLVVSTVDEVRAHPRQLRLHGCGVGGATCGHGPPGATGRR